MHRRSSIFRSAFTLLELVVVIAVLVILAGMVLPRLTSVKDDGSVQGTQTTLMAIRESICGSDHGPGYVHDMGNLPTTLAALFVAPAAAKTYDPVLGRGWHGPYLLDSTGAYVRNAAGGFTTDYGLVGDPAVVDAWNHAIVIQFPSDSVTPDPVQKMLFARLVSAGPDGIVQTPQTSLYPTAAQRGDDIVLFLMRPDIAP